MKKIFIFSLIILFLPLHVFADEIQGWHWYNEPVQKEEKEPELEESLPKNFSTLPAPEQMEIMKKLTNDALKTAILYPTVENTTTYIRMQNYWTEKATYFSQSWQKSLLVNPELDYNLRYSHYNATAPLQLEADRNKQELAIRILSKRYGLFFFYRGSEAIDIKLAEIVKSFTTEYQVSLIPVSIDGVMTASFPESVMNYGQAEKLGIKNYPALYLVDPIDGHYEPLAYGFITQDNLAKRYLNVATDFKPNF